jgi:hypothetical protein
MLQAVFLFRWKERRSKMPFSVSRIGFLKERIIGCPGIPFNSIG